MAVPNGARRLAQSQPDRDGLSVPKFGDSDDRCILFRVNLDVLNVALPDPSVRDHPRSHRMAEAIGSNDGILNTPAVDAACGRA